MILSFYHSIIIHCELSELRRTNGWVISPGILLPALNYHAGIRQERTTECEMIKPLIKSTL